SLPPTAAPTPTFPSPAATPFWLDPARIVAPTSVQFGASGQPHSCTDTPFPTGVFPPSVLFASASATGLAYGYLEGLPRLLDPLDRHRHTGGVILFYRFSNDTSRAGLRPFAPRR
ncbi:hypothetical protein ACU7M0_38395, partial [Burkholderia cenocepacia]